MYDDVIDAEQSKKLLDEIGKAQTYGEAKAILDSVHARDRNACLQGQHRHRTLLWGRRHGYDLGPTSPLAIAGRFVMVLAAATIVCWLLTMALIELASRAH